MRFSVITPSLNQRDWLQLCVQSVADQSVDVEHIVQDAGSTDGTIEWLTSRKDGVALICEPDKGMYDAINRGIRRANGEILSYLNCDEQYLPDALRAVEFFFAENPDIDVVFGYAVMVDTDGNFLCYRKTLVPSLWHTMTVHLTTLSAATFFRRRIFEEGIWFDDKYRCAGDAEWVCRLLRAGVRMAVLPCYLAAFTVTGTNQTTSSQGRDEAALLALKSPVWVRFLKPFLILKHRLSRLTNGVYSQKPFSYSIYSQGSPVIRVQQEVLRPGFRVPW